LTWFPILKNPGLVADLREQKSQHTLATIRRAAGFRLFFAFPPPKVGFPSLCLASNHKEALSTLGEAVEYQFNNDSKSKL